MFNIVSKFYVGEIQVIAQEILPLYECQAAELKLNIQNEG